MKARVVTVSDRCAAGEAQDRSGPLAVTLLAEHGVSADDVVVVPDEIASIAAAVQAGVADGVDLVLTTGGTGLSPRDVTPEAVGPLLERTLPGIAETLRAAARERVPTSVLSRGVAGVVGRTLVVTLPGSTGGVRDGVAVVGPLLAHTVDQLRGGDHR
ncbi:MAG TPA: MogA/MoaB family molybdenum cofactor biosynthesis protein [Mycobacteriales bacterium]|nr:MogA/MoaB family molybdenum cofactor biosynthesis protein [Mycobacteriales bacterium]